MTISHQRAIGIGLFLTVLLTAVIYWPGLSGGYVFDDFPNLVDNDRTVLPDLSPSALLQGALASDSGPLKRPIPMLMLSVERYLFGLDPWPMKLTNLIIHLLNTVLVFLLVRAVAGRYEMRNEVVSSSGARPAGLVVSASTFALLVAAAWGLAPINLTGVLFVIQRMESLATLFMLLGMLAWWRGRCRLVRGEAGAGLWMWGGMIGGGVLGLLSKESAVMLPVYVLLLEWLFFGFGRPGSAERRAVRWFFLLTLALPGLLGLAWIVPKVLGNLSLSNRPFDVYERLWTEGRVLWHYLTWIVMPNPGALSLYHDAFPISRGPLSPWTTLPAALGLVLLVGAAIGLRNRMRLVAFGVLWFFVMHLLVSTVLNLELVYEHRNYLGSLGILLALFAALLDARISGMVFLRRFAVVALIALYGFLTFLRANEWSNPYRLAYAEATRHVDSPRAQYELGAILVRASPSADSPSFSLAMGVWEEATALPGTSLLPWQGLVYEHARYGLPIDPAWWAGMRDYVREKTLSSQDMNALYSLVNAYTNDVPIPVKPMITVLDAARSANPRNVVLVTLKANFLLNVVGDYQEAARLLEHAVELRPANPAMWRNLIVLKLAGGKLHEADKAIRRLEELNRFGRQDKAIESYRRLLADKRADQQSERDGISPVSPEGGLSKN